jgi:shikimate kinase
MPSPTNITLIGMPGSGKTTVGRALADLLGWTLLDTDHLIEERAGQTLEQIIAAIGQQHFLELEAQTIRTLETQNTIIATGGSVVYDEEAMRHLRQLSTIIYLDVPLPEIEQRVGNLSVRGVIIAPGQSVADLHRHRDPLYRRHAHFILPTSNQSPEQTAQALVKLWQSHDEQPQ